MTARMPVGIAPASIIPGSKRSIPEKISSPSPPPPMRKASGTVPTLMTSAVRMPARMTGRAFGQFDAPQDLPRLHAHAARRLEHVRGQGAHALVAVAHDRQQRVEPQREDGRALADAHHAHGEREDGERRDGGADVQHLHDRLREPPHGAATEQDAERHADQDGEAARDEHQLDVLLRLVDDLGAVFEDFVEQAAALDGDAEGDGNRHHERAREALP